LDAVNEVLESRLYSELCKDKDGIGVETIEELLYSWVNAATKKHAELNSRYSKVMNIVSPFITWLWWPKCQNVFIYISKNKNKKKSLLRCWDFTKKIVPEGLFVLWA